MLRRHGDSLAIRALHSVDTDTELKYAFMGKNPDAADNRWLREALEARVPIIYFLGVTPGRYQPFWPVFITDWSASDLCATIAFEQDMQRDSPIEMVDLIRERRYAMTQVKRRLHHAAFDAHLIGIDQDYKVHIAHRLLDQHDGPMLESIKQLEGQKIRLPRREKDRPDQDRLAIRFRSFQEIAS